MTSITNFLEPRAYHAEDDRALLSATFTAAGTYALNPKSGIVRSGNPTVGAVLPPTSSVRSVRVNAFQAIVAGQVPTKIGQQGGYLHTETTDIDVGIDPNGSTNPRNDIIAIVITDQTYLGTTTSGGVIAVPGTPQASPVDPTAPANSSWLPLARVRVVPGATTFTSADITDLRTWTTGRGAALPVNNQAERDALTAYDGLRVYRLDAQREEVFIAGARRTTNGLVANPLRPYGTWIIATSNYEEHMTEAGFIARPPFDYPEGTSYYQFNRTASGGVQYSVVKTERIGYVLLQTWYEWNNGLNARDKDIRMRMNNVYPTLNNIANGTPTTAQLNTMNTWLTWSDILAVS